MRIQVCKITKLISIQFLKADFFSNLDEISYFFRLRFEKNLFPRKKILLAKLYFSFHCIPLDPNECGYDQIRNHITDINAY